MRLLVALVGLLACGHHDVQPTLTLTPGATVMTSAGAGTAPTASSTARPPVALTVLGPGIFEIENTSGASVKLKTVTRIERKDGLPLPLDNGFGFRLVEDCPAREKVLDECVELPAGAKMQPVAWSGMSCSSQCNMTCRGNSYMGPGEFRWVVSMCDEPTMVWSPLFSMPQEQSTMERFGFTMDVVSATVAKLHLPTQQFALGAPATPDHIAGFAVKRGTEHPLDAALLRAFLELVRDAHGFDDQIAKRCLMADLTGVRIVRSPRTTGAARNETLEIAFDTTCDKFFAVRGEGKHRVEMATHFDPSRAAFLAWASRLTFPGTP